MPDSVVALELQRQIAQNQYIVNLMIMLVAVMIAKEAYYVLRSFRRWLLAGSNGDPDAPATVKNLNKAVADVNAGCLERTEHAITEMKENTNAYVTSLRADVQAMSKGLSDIRDIARDVKGYVIWGHKPTPWLEETRVG